LQDRAAGQSPSQAAGVAPAKPAADDLAHLCSQAETMLVRGLQAQSAGTVDAAVAAAALSLAQLYVETRRPAESLTLLEHPQHGPLTLIAKGDSLAEQPGFTEEAYKTALRAYIGALPTASQPDDIIAKSGQIMEGMKKRLGDTPEGRKRLIAIYVGLAKDLESQLQRAEPDVKRALAKGFETFLWQLSEGATELNVLHWVGETLLGLGASFGEGHSPDAQAQTYYERSAATFQKILEKFPLDDPLKTQIRLRRAAALRGMQDFETAAKTLEQILLEKPLLLSVQVEAARTYQQWAATPGQADRYEQAILGAAPHPATQRNTVWGWAKIAQTTASYAQFKETFQEARYNLAVCRYNRAQSQQGPERDQTLEAAERDIDVTQRLYGLGDEERTRQYDALLKLIQTSRGKPADGLRALTSGTPKAGAAARAKTKR